MKASTGRQESAEDRILDAADRLLARGSYQQMTMDDLALEAGIPKGTIYLYFLSKPDVVLAHVDRIAARVLQGLQQIAASAAPAADKIRQMILLRVMMRFDSVQHYPETIGQVIHDLGPQLLQQRESHFAAETRVFAEVLKEANETVAVPASERTAVAAAIIAATNALLPYNLTASELGRRREVAEKTERIASMLLLGLLRGERAPKRRAA